MPTPKILLIYTGGTIGMVSDPATGALKPLDFSQIEQEIPALRGLGVEIEHYEDLTPIDSSDVTPANWVELARVIGRNYSAFDGFVVLHGTDTMAWTASALSFMLENLAKPVVFTGSQIPIGVMRTDGRENLVTAVEIAAAFSQESRVRSQESANAGGKLGDEAIRQLDDGANATQISAPPTAPSGGADGFEEAEKPAADAAPQLITHDSLLLTHDSLLMTPMVPEVSIYFQNRLFRANRTTKRSAEQLDAFTSENYPPLAEVGVAINYHREHIANFRAEKLQISTSLCTDVALVRLFPGMTQKVLEAALDIEGLRGVVLQTFGAGNAPTAPWFLDTLRRAVERGIVIVNVTQCIEGGVAPLYESGLRLSGLGVVGGRDMTTEAAMTKLMCVLGRSREPSEVLREMNLSLRGEMTVV